MNDSPIRLAVVLVAGKGTRMGQLTRELPKPMLRVGNKPILEHILEGLTTAGVERFLLVAGYHHEAIEQHFRGSPLKIEFRLQDPVNGTGSATLLARDFVGQECFLLTYGDILCDPSEYRKCARMLQQSQETAAIVAVKYVDDPWQGAAVYEPKNGS